MSAGGGRKPIQSNAPESLRDTKMNEYKKQIPNILTTLRFLMVPLFWWAFWNPDTVFEGRMLSFDICATAGVTDLVDGYLARKYKAISTYGKLMDPVADKLMTLSVLICFMLVGYTPTFFVAIFVAKDLILCIGALVLLRKKDIVVYSDIFGKAATYFLSMGLAMTFFEVLRPYNMYVLYLGLVVALIAFARYVNSAIKNLFGKPSE